MQIDNHFYGAYHLCRLADISPEDAYLIAYCNQFVDDCTPENVPPFEVGGQTVHPIYTQDYLWWGCSTAQRYIYVPYHFVPGDGCTIKGKKNPMAATPANEIVTSLFKKGLARCKKKEDTRLSLFRLAIAMHAFFDSFSHERFSGFREDWNGVPQPFYKFWMDIVPNIGHAEVVNAPDETSTTFEDPRDGYKRRNYLHFAECYKRLLDLMGVHYSDLPLNVLTGFFDKNMDNEDRADWVRKYHAVSELDYKPELWVEEAKGSDLDTYHDTDFGLFQKAAAEHRSDVWAALKKRNILLVG